MSAAVSLDALPLRTCHADGTVHFSTLKRIGDSGAQYLEALRGDSKSTPAQVLGTAVHSMVLGSRPGESLVRYSGRRAGEEWEAFDASHLGATILNDAEWAKAEAVAGAVLRDPVARDYMAGARFEVPLSWDDNGVACSTSGIDIVTAHRIGDLKTARTTHVETFQRQAFGLAYHAQLSWYRRGALANGIDVSHGVFVVAVETCPPYEVVVHDLADDILDIGERTVALWLERYRSYRDSHQWPGRAQSAVVWAAPSWAHGNDDDEEGT